MAQYHSNLAKFETATKSQTPPKPSRLFSTPARAQTLDEKALEAQYDSIKSTETSKQPSPDSTDGISRKDFADHVEFQKNVLRIDAFLGEWLSPDYFELVTAPPPSNMMVAGAKGELLRSAEQLQGAKIEADETPSDWGTHAHVNPSNGKRRSSFTMEQLARALPGFGSASQIPNHDSRNSANNASLPKLQTVQNIGYAPPTPTYALLAKDSIPTGYVAHARDACVNVDFQWDSMREPQNWGDGGTYGEEWSSMHRRFRKGLIDMVSWYKHKIPNFDPQDEHSKSDLLSQEEEDDYDDSDIIAVIVTHGAGCNALIGALTNQPVLMDVGMGSLTMAVHKGPSIAIGSPISPQRSHSSMGGRRRSSSTQLGLSDEYELQILASTEHLRAGADPLKIPALHSPKLMPSIAEIDRRSLSGSSGTVTPELDRPRAKNSSLGSMRRTTAKNRTVRTDSIVTSASTSSGGLWGSRASSVEKVEDRPPSPDTNWTLNWADSDKDVSNKLSSASPVSSTIRKGSEGSAGLWGAAPKPKEQKRRWTVYDTNK